MKMFMKGFIVAALTAFTPLPALADMTEINFGIISTESQKIQAELDTFPRCDARKLVEVTRSLHRLRRIIDA